MIRPLPRSTLFPYTTLFRSLAATAYLHSVMVQEKKNMLRVWNATLVTGAFCLSIFGTFLTRSGLINSIHPLRVRKRSEEHTSELQSRFDLVCRLLLEKKKQK